MMLCVKKRTVLYRFYFIFLCILLFSLQSLAGWFDARPASLKHSLVSDREKQALTFLVTNQRKLSFEDIKILHTILNDTLTMYLRINYLQEDTIIQCIEKGILDLSDIPSEYRTQKICLAAVSKHGNKQSLNAIPQHIRVQDQQTSQDIHSTVWADMLSTLGIQLHEINQLSDKKWEELTSKYHNIPLSMLPDQFLQKNSYYCIVKFNCKKCDFEDLETINKLWPQGTPLPLPVLQEIYITAVLSVEQEHQQHLINLIPEWVKTYDFYKELCKKNGMALHLVPIQDRTGSLCSLACLSSARALQYVPASIQNPLTQQESVPLLVDYACERLSQEAFLFCKNKTKIPFLRALFSDALQQHPHWLLHLSSDEADSDVYQQPWNILCKLNIAALHACPKKFLDESLAIESVCAFLYSYDHQQIWNFYSSIGRLVKDFPYGTCNDQASDLLKLIAMSALPHYLLILMDQHFPKNLKTQWLQFSGDYLQLSKPIPIAPNNLCGSSPPKCGNNLFNNPYLLPLSHACYSSIQPPHMVHIPFDSLQYLKSKFAEQDIQDILFDKIEIINNHIVKIFHKEKTRYVRFQRKEESYDTFTGEIGLCIFLDKSGIRNHLKSQIPKILENEQIIKLKLYPKDTLMQHDFFKKRHVYN